jgi:hypothetical protein
MKIHRAVILNGIAADCADYADLSV